MKDDIVTIESLSMFLDSIPLHEDNRVTQPHIDSKEHFLEGKRLSMELGPGGDRDHSYLFSLTLSTTQLLAWTRLRARVQAGELQP